MTEFYSDAQRALQDAQDTRRLADAMRDHVLRDALSEGDRTFIDQSDFFFLSTVDHEGFPSVSYKGGGPGFVRILDAGTLAFPSYDGNGMQWSLGNVARNPLVGLLFIDFERPRRLRLHGRATVAADDPLMADYAEAKLIVRVALEKIFPNCPRYIHRYSRVEASKFVPVAGCETPVPDWKRIRHFQEALPDADRERAIGAGPVIG